MMALGPKKDGGPSVKYFESPETLTALESVKQWLQKNAKKVETDEFGLGTILIWNCYCLLVILVCSDRTADE